MLYLFGSTVFLSAFLLFQVQPLIAKFILPWFGASPGVWATCMLFFQLLLLGGYAYAHLIVSRVPRRRQALVHMTLLGLALLTLPITPDDALKPAAGAAPTTAILWTLGLSVGLPYLLLSATGPLLQGWFARLRPGRSPYRLYALSNLGSLLALLSYPFVFERFMRLREQTGAWSFAYVGFALLCTACAWRLMRGGDPDAAPRPDETLADAPRPARTDVALWLLLSACGSALLLATTNQMCMDVAAVPFLWIVPLSLYLLTFILCFDHERWYVRPFNCLLMAVAFALMVKVLHVGVDLDIVRQVIAYSGMMFVCCMGCHGELARLKPAPRHLTFFFLMVSIGGAVGGLFVAVLAPHLFDGFYEYHLLLVLSYVLVLAVVVRQTAAERTRRAARPRWLRVSGRVCWALCLAALLYGTALFFDPSTWLGEKAGESKTSRLDTWLFNSRNVAWALPALLFLYLDALRWRRKVRFNAWWGEPRRLLQYACGAIACLGLVSLAGGLGWVVHEDDDYVAQGRNFYGVLGVDQYAVGTSRHYFSLYNGRINHGFQYVSHPEWPVSYYGPESGLGLAVRLHPKRDAPGRPFRIGVVGLGTGIVAAYANATIDPTRTDGLYVMSNPRDPPDWIGYYEINPLVERWSEEHFSYLADARARGARVEVFMGDARLVMERQVAEGNTQRLDVLAVDAFTSDAIPIHLLTRESVEIYFRHLNPDGILAIHVSNRYLDLVPVVRRLGDELGKDVVYVENEDDDDRGVDSSDWMLMSTNVRFLRHGDVVRLRSALPPAGPLWTDDFSSVFELIKRGDDDDDEDETGD